MSDPSANPTFLDHRDKDLPAGPPQEPAAESPTISSLRLFFRDFINPHWKAWAKVAVLIVMNVLLQLPMPLLTMYIIDRAVIPRNPGVLTIIGTVLIAVTIVRHISSYFAETISLRLKEETILTIEMALIRHLQRLPLTFFADKHSGYLQNRLMSDSRSVEGVLVRNFVTLFVEGFSLIVVLSLILFIRLDLGLLLLIFLIPFAYVRYYANERMRQFSKEVQETQALASTIVYEGFTGIRTIKAYQREDFYARLINSWLARLRDNYVKTNWFGILSSVGASFFTSMCVVIVLWYGCYLVIQGGATLGRVIGVYSYLGLLYGPINTIVGTNLRIHQSRAAVQRIYELLSIPQESDDGISLQSVKGAIEFRKISFGYAGGREVLHNVNFTVPSGSITAIVGRTGAGKSTLINLLLRFYEPQQGSILLDGTDIRQIAIRSLRKVIGVVDQHALMFDGTILKNIQFGNVESTPNEIIRASRHSYADEFIARLPNGYETSVGERGVRLSAGQCQRIVLARAFLKNPDILVMDEAVSSIDSQSEQYIQQALIPLLRNRTTILVAHRLSSLMLADHVIVLDEGRVVEQGSHRQLVELNGHYAKLFQEQFEVEAKVEARPEGAVYV